MLDLSEKLWRRILCRNGNTDKSIAEGYFRAGDESDRQEERRLIREVAACLQEAGGQDVSGKREQLREQTERCIRFLERATNPDPEKKIQEGIDDMRALLEDIDNLR